MNVCNNDSDVPNSVAQSSMMVDASADGVVQARNIHDGQWHSYLEVPTVARSCPAATVVPISGPLVFQGADDAMDAMDGGMEVCDATPFDYDTIVPSFDDGDEDDSGDVTTVEDDINDVPTPYSRPIRSAGGHVF